MFRISFFILLISSFSNLFSQKISYDIPEKFKVSVDKKEYQFIVDEALSIISKYEKVISIEDGIIKTEKK